MGQEHSYLLTNKEDIQIIKVDDLLNEYENKRILKVVHHKMEEGFPNFIVDLSRIDYMNSVGLNFLISIKNRAEQLGGNMAIAHASEKIMHLMEMTKLKPLFFLEQTIDNAFSKLKSI